MPSWPARARARDKVTRIYSDTVPQNDVRSALLRSEFAACLGDGFDLRAHHRATLFAQGTEITAMQRGNLVTGNRASFDLQNRVASTPALGVPFLLRDCGHLRAVCDRDAVAGLDTEIDAKAGVRIRACPCIGARPCPARATANT